MLHPRKGPVAMSLLGLILLQVFLTMGASAVTTAIVTIASDATGGRDSVATQGGQKLLEDSFGKLIAVYVDTSGRIGITWANSDPTIASSWATPVKSSSGPSDYTRPAAVLLGATSLRLIVEGGSGFGQINDLPVTIVRDGTNNISGMTFGSRTLLDGAGSAGYPTAILAHNGEILAAWFRGSSSDARVESFRWRPGIGWRSFSGSGLSPDDVIVDSSNKVDIFPSLIERRDNNRVYLLGNRGSSSSQTTLVFNKASFDGTNWSWGSQNLSYRTDAARGVADSTSLAWDAGRNLVIAAYDISGTTKYGSFTLSSSDSRTEIDTPSLEMTNNEWGAIETDENTGEYYLFTIDTASGAENGKLGYTRRVSGFWGSSLTIIDSETNNVGTNIRKIGSTGSIDLLYSKTASGGSSLLKFIRISISSSGSGDTKPPTMPGNLQATALDSSHVQLSWQASSDNVAVTGYDISRNGTNIATVGGSTTSFTDDTVQPSTSYTYTVVAFDAATNRSPAASASVTTPVAAIITTLAFTPTDDANIEQGTPTGNFGNDTIVYVDNSPVVNSLLKFNLTGVIANRVTSATLRLFCVDQSVMGGNFYTTSNIWNEATVTWSNAPPAAVLVGSLGSVTSDTWYQVDVKSVVTGNGPLSLRASSTSTDGARYSSSEGTDSPQLVIVMSNTGPTLNPIGSKTVNEESLLSFTATASDSENDPLVFSIAAGAPQGASITTSGVFSWTPSEFQGPGSYSITVVVWDGSLDDSETITVTVNEVNKAPVVNVPGPQTATSGYTLTFTVTAADPDIPANKVTLSATGLVTGMSFNVATGLFSFTPTSSQEGQSYTVSFTATDNGSPTLSDTKTVVITVFKNNPPVLATIGNKSINEGNLLSFTASATDPDANQTISYSLVGAPAGASINAATGVFSWTPAEAQGPGSYSFDVRATDSLGAFDSETISVSVNEVNQPPTIGPIADTSVDEETLLSIVLPVSDPDLPAQSITYTLTGNATGASINAATGTLNWTPTEAEGPGTYLLTVTVTDSYGASSYAQSFHVTVNDVNKPPVLTITGPLTIDEDTLLTLMVTAADQDIPANSVGLISASGLPNGATFDPSTGVFSWTPTEAQGPGSYTFSFSATDDGTPPLTGTVIVNVTVNEVDVAPVLASVGNKTVQNRSTLTFTATATDSDLPAQTLTYSLGPGAPRGTKIDAATGVFTWKPTKAQVGTHTVTIIVSDGTLTDSETITITVT